MSMLTPWKVNGNSKEEGGFKSLIFWNESMTLKWNFCRVGGVQLKKTYHGRGMDVFWNNAFRIDRQMSFSINRFACFESYWSASFWQLFLNILLLSFPALFFLDPPSFSPFSFLSWPFHYLPSFPHPSSFSPVSLPDPPFLSPLSLLLWTSLLAATLTTSLLTFLPSYISFFLPSFEFSFFFSFLPSLTSHRVWQR